MIKREDSGISGISTSATATTIDGSYGNDSVRSEITKSQLERSFGNRGIPVYPGGTFSTYDAAMLPSGTAGTQNVNPYLYGNAIYQASAGGLYAPPTPTQVTAGYQEQQQQAAIIQSAVSSQRMKGESPNEGANQRRGRQEGSSVGSEGDMSATLSPGSGSSGQRDQHNNNHNSNEQHNTTSASTQAAVAAAQQQWNTSNLCKAMFDARGQQRGRAEGEVPSTPNNDNNEDVWRPY